MQDETRLILDDLARLKRQGVIPTHCRCGSSGHCQSSCPQFVATPSLRDHAQDKQAFDRCLARITGTTTLRVLTMDNTTPSLPPCDGSHTCSCPSCDTERTRLVKRGGRGAGRQPWDVRPMRRAA